MMNQNRYAWLFLGFLLAHCPMGLAQGKESDMAVVDSFLIDRTEVTIGQFADFVAATGLQTAAERLGGGQTYEGGWVQRKGWTWRTPFGIAASTKEPAVHITFDEAKAYCKWAGKALTTDAQWLRAAYTEHRNNPPAGFAKGQSYPYPTGTSPVGANCLDECGPVNGAVAASKPELTSRGKGHAPVGSNLAGVNGLWDMGGNVWEWTDGGRPDQRPTRGGSWWYGAAQMHRDHLQTKPAQTAVVYIGFRCSKEIPAAPTR